MHSGSRRVSRRTIVAAPKPPMSAIRKITNITAIIIHLQTLNTLGKHFACGGVWHNATRFATSVYVNSERMPRAVKIAPLAALAPALAVAVIDVVLLAAAAAFSDFHFCFLPMLF